MRLLLYHVVNSQSTELILHPDLMGQIHIKKLMDVLSLKTNVDVKENLKASKFVETIRSLKTIKMDSKKQDIAVTIGVIAWFAIIIAVAVIFC